MEIKMVKESMHIVMEVFMMVHGWMIRRMAMVYIDMLMEINIMDFGPMIRWMDWENIKIY